MTKNWKTSDTLIMKTPASWHRDLYREAAPAGNGLIGAYVYGGLQDERIAVNHADLWEKGKKQELPDVRETLQQTRETIDRGDYWGGNWFGANALKEQGYSPRLGNPVPVGDVVLKMEERKLFKHYRRLVHMDTGEVETVWEEQGKQFSRKLFVSRKRDLVFYRIEAEMPFSFSVGAGCHETWEDDTKKKWENQTPESFVERNAFGFCAKHEDETWYGLIGEVKTDGKLETIDADKKLWIREAGWAVIVIRPVVFANRSLQETYKESGFLQWEEELFDYERMKEEHVCLHRALYESAELTFSENDPAGNGDPGRSNEELIAQAFEEEAPAELLEKQWKFGRYLMICGTREDGLPFPLYGLWHGRYKMPWPHNMANENVEMIYWHTYVGNLESAVRPLIHYYTGKMPQFRECAQKLFGLPGIYLPAGTTPEHCYPTQIVPVILNWIGCAGWLAQMFYRYYQYTGDEELLEKEILPFMLEAGEFYENYITRDERGKIRIYPSVSPENTPGNLIPPEDPDMPHPCPSVENATMDIAIMKELFTNLLEISEKKEIHEDKRGIWRAIIADLPAYETTADGDVREWQKDGLDQRYNHRHLSHIYPLFPGTEIVRGRDDEAQVKAFEKAVDKRVLGAQTGWSLAHMASIYARLQRPEKVMECLDIMDKVCLLKNFFTLHNDWRGMGLTLGKGSFAPVQLDAAMGVVQALQECLLFVDKDCIKLLPALPERLGKGAFHNFRFMTGTVSAEWDLEHGALKAQIHAERDTALSVILPDWAKDVRFTVSGASETGDGQKKEAVLQKKGGQGGEKQSIRLLLAAGSVVDIETGNYLSNIHRQKGKRYGN